jgi:signal transduction histidine kinase
MRKDVEVANLKSGFVATVSHELRTPLTGIRALSEVLKDGRVSDERTRLQYCATIHRETERLSRMIENILDFSKIDAGLKEYRFERTDPGKLTREVADRFREWTADAGFRLELRIGDALPAASLDREAVSRALLNVLDNAAKYSGDNRVIELSAGTGAEHIEWEIRDHGPGIAPDDLPRVFERFFRSAKNLDSNIRGSGVGLTIVKHTVEAHGGTISIESVEDRGTTVRIEIPAENSHGQSPA